MEQKFGIGQIYGGIQLWEMHLDILHIHWHVVILVMGSQWIGIIWILSNYNQPAIALLME
jgi:hypothetical protein